MPSCRLASFEAPSLSNYFSSAELLSEEEALLLCSGILATRKRSCQISGSIFLSAASIHSLLDRNFFTLCYFWWLQEKKPQDGRIVYAAYD
jgi:hypothetical protein